MGNGIFDEEPGDRLDWDWDWNWVELGRDEPLKYDQKFLSKKRNFRKTLGLDLFKLTRK